MRVWWCLLLAIFCLGLAGCGSTTPASSTSPQQHGNAQRDAGYLRAVNQILAPFNKPPANPTDYATASRELQTASGRLEKLSPPAPFATSHARLLAAIQAQAALIPRLERATQAKDRIALSNLEAENLQSEAGVRGATNQIVGAYERCRRAKFANC
jgi:hypothetical protein